MDRFGVLLLVIGVYFKPLFVFFIFTAFCISECTDTTDPLDKAGDVKYKDWYGDQLDEKMLQLLQKY